MDLYFKLGFMCFVLTIGLVQATDQEQSKQELGDLKGMLQQYLDILKKETGNNKDTNQVSERAEPEQVQNDLNSPAQKDGNTADTLKKEVEELKAAQKYIQEEKEKLEHEKDNIGLIARLLIDILEDKDATKSSALDMQRRRRPCPGCPGR